MCAAKYIVGKLSAPLRRLALFLILIYRYAVSPFMAPCCRFYPSCSEYAEQSIKHYGSLRGGWLSIKRILKCHPFHRGGYDPMPDGISSFDKANNR